MTTGVPKGSPQTKLQEIDFSGVVAEICGLPKPQVSWQLKLRPKANYIAVVSSKEKVVSAGIFLTKTHSSVESCAELA